MLNFQVIYQTSLDTFKATNLSLPPDLPIEIDDSLTGEFTAVIPAEHVADIERPAHDDLAPVNASVILFVKMAPFAARKPSRFRGGRGELAESDRVWRHA